MKSLLCITLRADDWFHCGSMSAGSSCWAREAGTGSISGAKHPRLTGHFQTGALGTVEAFRASIPMYSIIRAGDRVAFKANIPVNVRKEQLYFLKLGVYFKGEDPQIF